MIGGLGLTPSGNIGMDGVAVFEAVSPTYYIFETNNFIKIFSFRMIVHIVRTQKYSKYLIPPPPLVRREQ